MQNIWWKKLKLARTALRFEKIIDDTNAISIRRPSEKSVNLKYKRCKQHEEIPANYMFE